ncbi:hypothetical protein SAMN03097699_2947 [Flavobacteriaceae bacterium MAR_2010_188]|nr:hypothetical protein SAMN03097699_2947 [Flavobacteriaceae bacterium MAR_2010_188]
MDQKYFTISKHKISNHCPECYSAEGLELTCRQRFNETTFYKAIAKETRCDLYCETCDSEIFPVRWTDDIERVVDYHRRGLKPKRASIKLKKLTWILIIVAIILVAVMVVSYFNDTDVI